MAKGYSARGGFGGSQGQMMRQQQMQQKIMQMQQQMAKAQDVNEELKERDQMAWVGAMNNIQSAAREVMRSRYE